jgi:hypothetical protein
MKIAVTEGKGFVRATFARWLFRTGWLITRGPTFPQQDSIEVHSMRLGEVPPLRARRQRRHKTIPFMELP